MKGVIRFMMRGKISSWYVRPFEILKLVGEVAYFFPLHSAFLAIHLVFHLFTLQKYILDESHLLWWDSVQLDERLAVVEVLMSIFSRDIRRLHSRDIQ